MSQTKIIGSNIINSLKYLRFTTLRCKEIGIRKSIPFLFSQSSQIDDLSLFFREKLFHRFDILKAAALRNFT